MRARGASREAVGYADFLKANQDALRRYLKQLVWQEIRALALWRMEPIGAENVVLEGLTAVEL
jgi:hypothetical protein